MKQFPRISVLLTVFLFIAGALWAASKDAVFLSVYGKVTVKDISGNTRTVQAGSKAAEGETVSVAEDAKATLVFFDGSTLDVKPHSQFVIAALRQPSEKAKNLKFDLLLGGLVARVQKLLTAESVFEISAGGVVCGVRGTEFSVDYAPPGDIVDLRVIEGSVYARAMGQSYIVPAGQQMEFINARPQGQEGQTLPLGKSKPNEANPDAVVVSAPSLALVDLNNQFAGILSINASGQGGPLVTAPVLGSSLGMAYPTNQLLSLAGPMQIVLPNLPFPISIYKLAP